VIEFGGCTDVSPSDCPPSAVWSASECRCVCARADEQGIGCVSTRYAPESSPVSMPVLSTGGKTIYAVARPSGDVRDFFTRLSDSASAPVHWTGARGYPLTPETSDDDVAADILSSRGYLGFVGVVYTGDAWRYTNSTPPRSTDNQPVVVGLASRLPDSGVPTTSDSVCALVRDGASDWSAPVDGCVDPFVPYVYVEFSPLPAMRYTSSDGVPVSGGERVVVAPGGTGSVGLELSVRPSADTHVNVSVVDGVPGAAVAIGASGYAPSSLYPITVASTSLSDPFPPVTLQAPAASDGRVGCELAVDAHVPGGGYAGVASERVWFDVTDAETAQLRVNAAGVRVDEDTESSDTFTLATSIPVDYPGGVAVDVTPANNRLRVNTGAPGATVRVYLNARDSTTPTSVTVTAVNDNFYGGYTRNISVSVVVVAGRFSCLTPPHYPAPQTFNVEYSDSDPAVACTCNTLHGVCDGAVGGSGLCLSCDPGWYGLNCNDECASRNCSQRGTCRDGITGDGACVCSEDNWDGAAACGDCAPGFYGVDCEPCLVECLNGGACDDGIAGDSRCICAGNWDPVSNCATCIAGRQCGASGGFLESPEGALVLAVLATLGVVLLVLGIVTMRRRRRSRNWRKVRSGCLSVYIVLYICVCWCAGVLVCSLAVSYTLSQLCPHSPVCPLSLSLSFL
jgi:hypothetical protein